MCSVLNVKAVVAAFNQEKALVGAFSVITNLHMERFEALLSILTLHRDNTLTMMLRSAARADSGQYQCQVSTTPIITHDVWLTVKGETSYQSARVL